MNRALEGIGAFHAELIENYVRGFFLEGRGEAIEAIARAYRTEAGQAALWANGSPRAFEAGPWPTLWRMGMEMA